MPKGTRKKPMPDKQNDHDKVDDKAEEPIETNITRDVDIGSQEALSEYAIGEDGLPAKWKNIPFEDMKVEGWRPRIKKKGGREYLTIRRTWFDSNRKLKALERGMGPFDEKRYKILQDLLLDQDSTETEGDNEDASPRSQGSSITISDVDESSRPKRFPQPPAWTVKGTRILQSAVGKHINIPDRFYYDTDILEFYEYFHNKGYVGSIVDWIHECLRNYMIEHNHKVGVIIEKGMMIQNG